MKSLLIALLSVSALLASLTARAEEPKKDPPKTPAAADAPKEGEKKDEIDIYKVPEGADATSDALVAFCKKLMTHRPASAAEAQTHRAKLLPALKTATTQILTLEKGDATANGHFARGIQMQLELGAAMSNPKGPAFAKFIDDAAKFAESDKLDNSDVNMLSTVARNLQYVDADKAKGFYEKLLAIFGKSALPAAKQQAAEIPGVLRRLNLPGQVMELTGKTFDGKDFDLKSLKGKVVLVDYWATWCGPCRAELPNVKKNYEGYHGKGFEVVGISGDRDRAALEKFLTADPLPWTTIHEMENGAWKPNPSMEKYGINAYPTTLLVGKDGKVVALNARGPKLGELLKAQLGEPEPPKEPAKDAPPAKEPAKDSKVGAAQKGDSSSATK
ncbi:MAG TPA: redoxin family protein [Planctomycetota bacterium]|nr:redoxin family protein [Planctomycetota bacterium]